MSDFQVMASNDLRTGRVVYLAPEGRWENDFQQALQLEDDVSVAVAEQQADKSVGDNLVVDPYLVKVAANTERPSHIRERIRRTGPTCLPVQETLLHHQIAG